MRPRSEIEGKNYNPSLDNLVIIELLLDIRDVLVHLAKTAPGGYDERG